MNEETQWVWRGRARTPWLIDDLLDVGTRSDGVQMTVCGRTSAATWMMPPTDALALADAIIARYQLAPAPRPSTTFWLGADGEPAHPADRPTPDHLRWKGDGPQPAHWTAADGTIVYRSYADYCDD